MLARKPPYDRWALIPLALVTAIAAVDAIADLDIVLIGFLVLGPLLASLRAGPRATALVGAYVLALSVLLGAPNDIFGGTDHAARVLVVALGAGLAVWMARLRAGRAANAVLLAVQGSAARSLAESPTLAEATPRILEAIGQTVGWEVGAIWEVDRRAELVRRVGGWSAPGVDPGAFEELSAEIEFAPGVGLPGRVWQTGRPARIRDVVRDPNFPRAKAAAATGLHGAFGFPITSPRGVVGVIEFLSREVREADRAVVDAMGVLGGQIGQSIERKRAEEAVQDSEAMKTAMLESALDCVITMDHKGRVVEFNEAAETTFGYQRSEAIGTEMAKLIIPPSMREQHREGLARYLETGEGPLLDRRLEITAFRSDGTEFPVELAITRIKSPGPPLFTGYLRDITERAHAEEERTRLLDAEREARLRAERAERRAAFLAETGRILSRSLDYNDTLQKVARLAVPEIADSCVVNILDEDDKIKRLAVAHVDPSKEPALWALQNPPDPELERGSPQVIRTGVPELIPEVTDEIIEATLHEPEQIELVRILGMRSVMVVPLAARGRIFGAMSFGAAESGRRYGQADLAFAEELATRCAVAIDNARLYTDHSYIARTLQDSLLPPELPQVRGLEIAASYHAAGEANEVGGDFYDVFQAGERVWGAVIGDVRGKGADAAALIGLARHTLRAAAMTTSNPPEILETLNEALLREGTEDSFCTAIYVCFEPGDSAVQLVLASGGHPLPFAVRADGTVETVGSPGTLLGAVPEPQFERDEAVLHPGDMLVLYTDGVTEARSDDGLFGQDRLSSLLGESLETDAAGLCNRIENRVLDYQDGQLADDLAVLVLRMPATATTPGGQAEGARAAIT